MASAAIAMPSSRLSAEPPISVTVATVSPTAGWSVPANASR
jgi:hypothetical protein